jgi:hypothetical protein
MPFIKPGYGVGICYEEWGPGQPVVHPNHIERLDPLMQLPGDARCRRLPAERTSQTRGIDRVPQFEDRHVNCAPEIILWGL